MRNGIYKNAYISIIIYIKIYIYRKLYILKIVYIKLLDFLRASGEVARVQTSQKLLKSAKNR